MSAQGGDAQRIAELRAGGPVLRHSPMVRVHHAALGSAVLVLVVTGFGLRVEALAFLAPLLGGPWIMGIAHRTAGVVLAITFAHHLAFVVMPGIVRAAGLSFHEPSFMRRVGRLWTELTLLPDLRDLRDMAHTVRYWVGREPRDHPGGRYPFRFKLHYLAILWGIPAMGLTGLVLAMPVRAASVLADGLSLFGLPATTAGVIHVSEVLHGEEALLVVAVSILWHGYRVLFPLRRDMFTGTLTVDELRRDHGRWYDELAEASKRDAETETTDEAQD